MKCPNCGHDWIPRSKNPPRRCPECHKSIYPKKRRRLTPFEQSIKMERIRVPHPNRPNWGKMLCLNPSNNIWAPYQKIFRKEFGALKFLDPEDNLIKVWFPDWYYEKYKLTKPDDWQYRLDMTHDERGNALAICIDANELTFEEKDLEFAKRHRDMNKRRLATTDKRRKEEGLPPLTDEQRKYGIRM